MYKAFAMDPLESDADKTVNSQLDTENYQDIDNKSDMEFPEETNEDSKTGIYSTHHQSCPYF